MKKRVGFHIILKNFKKRIVLWILLFLIFMIQGVSVSALAQTKQSSMTDIRVGLKSLYGNVNQVKISNNSIGIGYCIDDRYVVDEEFVSSTGFTFQVAKGYYYIMDKTFQTYQTAKSAADLLRGLSVNAVPVCLYRNYWKVYIGGSTIRSEMNTVYERIKNRYGFTYGSLQEDNGHRVLVSGSSVSFLIDAEKKSAYPQVKAMTANSSSVYTIDLGSRQYRGRVEIGRYGKDNLSVVNIVNIETYLYGVVPSEMVSSWPMEALKAQAVCARSFALSKTSYNADSNIFKPYNIEDTTASQVYRGYGVEALRTSNAVDATKGEVVMYERKLIPAYFFSTSGGSTEDGSAVWGNEVPYLKGVPDLYELEPERAPWIVSYTASELAKRLSDNRIGVGTINNVVARITTESGRVYSLKILGSDSNLVMQTGTIRTVLDLASTKFKVIKYGDIPDTVSIKSASSNTKNRISDCYILSSNGVEKADTSIEQFMVKGSRNLMNYPVNAPKDKNTYYFAGVGYGHGVGLSQSGAKGMANASFTYHEIIEHYYTNCVVQNIN